jgi:hypothetical protein
VSVTSAALARRADRSARQVAVPGPGGPPATRLSPVAARQRQTAYRRRPERVPAPAAARVISLPRQQPVAGAARYRVRELQVRQVRVRQVRSTQSAALGSAHRPGAVRLTRRGRVVVAGLAVVVTLIVVALVWLSVAGGAQASDRGRPPGSVYQGMTQVVVRPGQNLWSIASAAEPAADPRLVVEQIIEANALGGAMIHAGQLLWVPSS